LLGERTPESEESGSAVSRSLSDLVSLFPMKDLSAAIRDAHALASSVTGVLATLGS